MSKLRESMVNKYALSEMLKEIPQKEGKLYRSETDLHNIVRKGIKEGEI